MWLLFVLVHWVTYALQVRLCLKSTWYKLQGKKLNMDENLTGTRSSVMSVSGTSSPQPSWQFFIYHVLKHSLSNIRDMCFCLFVLSSFYYDIYPILAIFIFIFHYLWNASTPMRGLRNWLRIFRVDTVQGNVQLNSLAYQFMHMSTKACPISFLSCPLKPVPSVFHLDHWNLAHQFSIMSTETCPLCSLKISFHSCWLKISFPSCPLKPGPSIFHHVHWNLAHQFPITSTKTCPSCSLKISFDSCLLKISFSSCPLTPGPSVFPYVSALCPGIPQRHSVVNRRWAADQRGHLHHLHHLPVQQEHRPLPPTLPWWLWPQHQQLHLRSCALRPRSGAQHRRGTLRLWPQSGRCSGGGRMWVLHATGSALLHQEQFGKEIETEK